MLDRLSMEGRVVLITGGGTGLGLAMVRALARAGADVCIAGRRQAPIDTASAEVEALGRKSLAISTASLILTTGGTSGTNNIS